MIVSPELAARYGRFLEREPHDTRCTGCKQPLDGKYWLKVCTEAYGVLCNPCAKNLVGTTRRGRR